MLKKLKSLKGPTSSKSYSNTVLLPERGNYGKDEGEEEEKRNNSENAREHRKKPIDEKGAAGSLGSRS